MRKEEGLRKGLSNSFVVGLALVLILAVCPALVGAGVGILFPTPIYASTCNIDITATGSEVDISCNVTLWAIGIVRNGETKNTGTDNVWGAVTNDGSEAVDLTVYGNDMEGGAVTWTLSSAGPGASQIRMMVGLPTGDNYTIEKEGVGSYLTWKSGLASAASQTFGLYFEAPTSGTGNENMQMTDGGAGPTGVVITASL